MTTYYSGRTIDEQAFRQTAATPLVQALVMPGDGGSVCTGILKLVQRWLLEFITVQGSMPFLPKRGCSFFQQLRAGNLRTVLDLQQSFYLAARQVYDNLTAEDKTTDPNDEQLDSAELQTAVLSGANASLAIKVNSKAGDARIVLLPIIT